MSGKPNNEKQDLLIEIGTEELPPKALKRLAIAFCDGVQQGLEKSQLAFDKLEWLLPRGDWRFLSVRSRLTSPIKKYNVVVRQLLRHLLKTVVPHPQHRDSLNPAELPWKISKSWRLIKGHGLFLI